MDELLRRFQGDTHTKEALKAYLIATIGEEAKDKAFRGEDTSHIKDAHESITKAFDNLENEYGTKPVHTKTENPAR